MTVRKFQDCRIGWKRFSGCDWPRIRRGGGDRVDCEDGGCACGIVEYSKEIFPQGYRKIDEKEGQGIIAVNTRMVASDYGGGKNGSGIGKYKPDMS